MSANPESLPRPVTPIGLVPSRYVTIELAELCTGYTMSAMNKKIDKGVWLEGEVWKRAPDGRRLVDLRGYERWVEQGRPGDVE